MNFNIHLKKIKIINKVLKFKKIYNKNKLIFKTLFLAIILIILPFVILSFILKLIIVSHNEIDYRYESNIKIKVTDLGLIPNKIKILPRKRYNLIFEKNSVITQCTNIKILEQDLNTQIHYNKPINLFLFYEGEYTLVCEWFISTKLNIQVRS